MPLIRTVTAILLLALLGCSHHAIHFTKGPGDVYAHPKVHVIARAGVMFDPAPWEPLVTGDLFTRLAEYGVGAGTWTYAVDPVPMPNDGPLTDLVFIAEIDREIADGLAPAPTSEDVYVVLIPGLTPFLTSAHATGFHALSLHYAFAIVGNRSGYYGGVLSHELYEAATDPAGFTWRDWTTFSEVGDVCEDQWLSLDGVWVQKVWSQKTFSCQ